MGWAYAVDSPALWVLLFAVVALVAALASKTVRRFAVTYFLVGRALLLSVVDRAIGRPPSSARRLREAFEKLGPTYVKLAQLVASSEGMFPDAYCVEFQKCLDRVPPFPQSDVDLALLTAFGKHIDDIFSSIDEKPLASASIAQVHGAVLKDGTKVVVKVQRPGLQRTVTADLRVLRALAWTMERLPQGELASPMAIVDDFERNLHEELDFRLEAKNLDEFNAIMDRYDMKDVAAPKPIHDLTSASVLVMERFFGSRIDDKALLTTYAGDIEERLLQGMRAWFRCLIVHGFFHGDVHAGNLMVLDDGRIGFLDFGIVGRFQGAKKGLVSDFLLSMASRNFKQLASSMLDMGGSKGVDVDAMAKDLEEQCAPLLDPSRPAKYTDLLPAVTRASMRHRMPMPRDFVLILKQMIYFDRYAKLLAPKLNIFADPRIIRNLMEDLMLAKAEASRQAA
jgi:predicted unusual protein kinase regulating ubiquinone biosynthesis (AarF/ABC1/UbiB family)